MMNLYFWILITEHNSCKSTLPINHYHLYTSTYTCTVTAVGHIHKYNIVPDFHVHSTFKQDCLYRHHVPNKFNTFILPILTRNLSEIDILRFKFIHKMVYKCFLFVSFSPFLSKYNKLKTAEIKNKVQWQYLTMPTISKLYYCL